MNFLSHFFQFPPALLALPLALLPVVFHLLFQRKAPVLLFSTIRFIQSSVQRTAVRKRVQRWLLLACRVLLLFLLIFAVAQPKCDQKPDAKSATPGKSAIAAIVVDSSYSMLVEDHQQTLLAKADASLHELLTGQFVDAKVAVFRTLPPPPHQPERLQDAGKIHEQIERPLTPQPNPGQLVDRVASAVGFLDRQQADDKWLVVISDFQKREFPSQFPHPKFGHIVMIDLHAEAPRSAGVTRVAIDPARPTLGTDSEAVVDITGKPQTSRPVKAVVQLPDGQTIWESGVQVASLNSAGRATVRFPMKLPAQLWMVLKAALQDEDDMKWDDWRSHLIATPPKQVVTFLGPRPSHDAPQYPIWLALDPFEGGPQPWPLRAKAGNDISPDSNVAVLLAGDWPDDLRTTRLLNFARGGGTLILFLRPGLEETWKNLPPARKTALLEMLPSEPMPQAVAPANTVSMAAPNDPLFAGFKPEWFNGIFVKRLIPFSSDPQGTTLLKCYPQDPRPGLRPAGLLYRRAVGAGAVYTVATLQDSEQYSNIAIPPVFIPLLVGMALPGQGRTDAQNVEIGQPLVLTGRQYDALDSVTIQPPPLESEKPQAVPLPKETIVVLTDRRGTGKRFTFGPTNRPGLYTWHRPGSDEPLAISNVQLPGTESDLLYIPAAKTTEPGGDVAVFRSVDEMKSTANKQTKPRPLWPLVISIVLLLLCAEALMASVSRLWRTTSQNIQPHAVPPLSFVGSAANPHPAP